MSTQAAQDIAEQLWQNISSHAAYLAFKVPEDKAEILDMLGERVEEEIWHLLPDHGRAD